MPKSIIEQGPEFYNEDYWKKKTGFPIDAIEDNGICFGIAQLYKRWGITRMLDVGCGFGWTLKHLRGMGIESFGTDFSRYVIENSPNKNLIVEADMTNALPFENASFEFVTCNGVLEHIPSKKIDRAISELCRVSSKYIYAMICIEEREHEPSHITVRSREWWINNFRTFGNVELSKKKWEGIEGNPECFMFEKVNRTHMGETSKAEGRRLKEFFFNRFTSGEGIDIGHGGDPITSNCDGWEKENGDAQYIEGIPDDEYDYVYSSHVLEHMYNPDIALINWFRIIRPGGFLILYLPHRDLYERKKTLPSKWSREHKHFLLIDRDDPPDTLGVIPLINRILGVETFSVEYAKICDEGYNEGTENIQPSGEYSMEIILKKI